MKHVTMHNVWIKSSDELCETNICLNHTKNGLTSPQPNQFDLFRQRKNKGGFKDIGNYHLMPTRCEFISQIYNLFFSSAHGQAGDYQQNLNNPPLKLLSEFLTRQ